MENSIILVFAVFFCNLTNASLLTQRRKSRYQDLDFEVCQTFSLVKCMSQAFLASTKGPFVGFVFYSLIYNYFV